MPWPAHRRTSRMANEVDPLFLAVLQPVLRGAAGEPLSLQPAPRTAASPLGRPGEWRAQRLAPALRERLRWCLAHSAPHDPAPWWAGHDRIFVLVDGHRPLTIQPQHPWVADGPPADAPYPAVLALRAGGLLLFFVNASIAPDGSARACVRVFAVDGQQAVEADPVPDVQLFDAWAADGAVWACGMRSRHTDASGTGHFGHGVLLRFAMRPLALAEQLGGAQWLDVSPAAGVSEQTLRDRVQGIEAWLAHAQDGQGGHWLLGAPLAPLHFSPDSPLWLPGPLTPSDHADLVLARWQPGRPPLMEALVSSLRWVAGCRSSEPAAARWYLARGGLQRLGHLVVGDLVALSPAPQAEALLGEPQPLRIEGLPRSALDRTLADLDVIHDPRFGYAASLSWLLPDTPGRLMPAAEGVLMRSGDGVRWEVVQETAGA